MMTTFGPLATVTLRGFAPDDREDWDNPPGTALYLLGLYGCQADGLDPSRPGILAHEPHAPGGRFEVLIAAGEVDALIEAASSARYVVERVDPLAMPQVFREDDGLIVDVRWKGSGWVMERR